MTQAQRKRRAEKLTTTFLKQYGDKGASIGARPRSSSVIPTGILGLDFALGTGGWVRGTFAEVFGPPDLGKTSAIGISSIREAQNLGMLCGYIAVEPGITNAWLEDNDANPEDVIVGYPDTSADAFDMLYTMIYEKAVDHIVFDSLGALGNDKEKGEGAKKQVGGASGIITSGFQRVIQRADKNEISVLFVNQIRDKIGGNVHPGTVQSPGGWAKQHFCPVRVQLRPGKQRIEVKEGDSTVLYGREVIAKVVRNKLAKGSNQKANFLYYQKEHPDHDIGIDHEDDVLNMGLALGLVKVPSKGYFAHSTFPQGKLHGREKVKAFLAESNDADQVIREEVLAIMHRREEEARREAKKKREARKNGKVQRKNSGK